MSNSRISGHDNNPPSLSSVFENHQRLMTETMAANTRLMLPFIRAAIKPMMVSAKTGIYFSFNPLVAMTGFNKTDS